METIREFLTFLLREDPSQSAMDWPPDAFACSASLLERSGGYLPVVGDWPPSTIRPAEQWTTRAKTLGKKWRDAAARDRGAPVKIRNAWQRILDAGDQTVSSIAGDGGEELRNALLLIVACSDEACEGVGIPGETMNEFESKALDLLVAQERSGDASTLCKRISTSKLSVLPKLHTPQTGITIRSLSHHLAMCHAAEVKPRWIWVDHPQIGSDRHGLNVLILPWPLHLHPSAFSSAVPRCGQVRNMDPKFGFFQFQVRGGEGLNIALLERLVSKSRETCGAVDIIVFPELALSNADMESLSDFITGTSPQPIIVGGMCAPAPGLENGICRNTSVTIVPLPDGRRAYALAQDKHHRWLLNGEQVAQYGLGGRLDPTVSWWEHTVLSRRELSFLSVQPWLTLCTLICEDLARPDPIANLVRSVGPNLIIALLMDGPQLASRWPARYGTVLADDPGSSVLTVSPLGMVKLSRGRNLPESNVIALWKDARSSAPTEISLPDDHEGVVLSLTRNWREEYSADGRPDKEMTAYLTLSGVHAIRDNQK
jgi:hypothetical protein